MKRGISPIISVVLSLVIVISALVIFRTWYLKETSQSQLTISDLTDEQGIQSLEDIVVENCDGVSLTMRNRSVTDIYIRRNGAYVISLYLNNTEIYPAQFTISPAIDVLHPGQVLKISGVGGSIVPLGQVLKLTTENRRSLFFSYNIGSVVLMADRDDIWANDGNDTTNSDASTVTAFVRDSFGNPITSQGGYPVVEFYVDNGTMNPATAAITNGIATSVYRSSPNTNGEIKSVEGVWYHYDKGAVTASVSEKLGLTVIRTVRGSMEIKFKSIINSYTDYPTAYEARRDEDGSSNTPNGQFLLTYRDGQYVTQTSHDTSTNRNDGASFPTGGQWTRIHFYNVLPSNVTDSNYTLTSVRVLIYHYESGASPTTMFQDFRDDLWVNDYKLTGNWKHFGNFPLLSGPPAGPFQSVNLIKDSNGNSVINTIVEVNDMYVSFLYNPCFLSDSVCSTSDYLMRIDYAAIIVEYTKK